MPEMERDELIKRAAAMKKEEIEVMLSVFPVELIYNEIGKRLKSQKECIELMVGALDRYYGGKEGK